MRHAPGTGCWARGLAAALALTVAGSAASGPPTLSFGVVPQRAAVDLARAWTPVLNYLGARTGYRFVFRTARDIPTFERRLARGEYDLAYMNPYHYVVFHHAPGYRAIAKEKNRWLVGILVVPRDSPWRGVRELNGQTLAFPAPGAFAASIVVRAYLRSRGVVYRTVYVSSHDSVYQAVARGLAAGGGGVLGTYNDTPATVRERLRILWRSRAYPPHTVAVRPHLGPEVVRRVLRALATLDREPQGREALRALGFQGFAAASDDDYDGIRGLEPDIRRLLPAGSRVSN